MYLKKDSLYNIFLVKNIFQKKEKEPVIFPALKILIGAEIL